MVTNLDSPGQSTTALQRLTLYITSRIGLKTLVMTCTPWAILGKIKARLPILIRTCQGLSYLLLRRQFILSVLTTYIVADILIVMADLSGLVILT